MSVNISICLLESARGATGATGAAVVDADWNPEKSPKSPLALELGSTAATEVEDPEELFLGWRGTKLAETEA